MHVSRRVLAALPAVLLLATLSACTSAGDAGVSPASSRPTAAPTTALSTAATPTATPSSTTEIQQLFNDGVALIAEPNLFDKEGFGDGQTGVVRAIRMAPHDEFDRVVIDLAGPGVPGYLVRYEEQAYQDGSGHPITVAGEANLVIYVHGVTYPFEWGLDDTVAQDGDVAALHVVTEVHDSGSFEGTHQIVLGIAGGEHGFAVGTLEDPTRLVIDIATG